jgi:hypothetical protein
MATELVGYKFKRRIIPIGGFLYEIQFKYNNPFYGFLFGWQPYVGQYTLEYSLTRIHELTFSDVKKGEPIEL